MVYISYELIIINHQQIKWLSMSKGFFDVVGEGHITEGWGGEQGASSGYNTSTQEKGTWVRAAKGLKGSLSFRIRGSTVTSIGYKAKEGHLQYIQAQEVYIQNKSQYKNLDT